MTPLTNVLPVPASPSELPSAEDWARADAAYGPLPRDYVDFLGIYGTGYIDSFLIVLNPASRNQYVNFLTKGGVILNAMNEVVQAGENWPFGFHPVKGGLVPVAVTDNGDMIFWKTVGEPDRWPIVVIESRGPDTQQFAMTLSEFLAGVLSRALVCDIFPRGFPSDTPTFSPLQA